MPLAHALPKAMKNQVVVTTRSPINQSSLKSNKPFTVARDVFQAERKFARATTPFILLTKDFDPFDEEVIEVDDEYLQRVATVCAKYEQHLEPEVKAEERTGYREEELRGQQTDANIITSCEPNFLYYPSQAPNDQHYRERWDLQNILPVGRL